MNILCTFLLACGLSGLSQWLLRGDTPVVTDSTRESLERLRNQAAEFYRQADYTNALAAMKQAVQVAEGAWGEQSTNITGFLDLTAGIHKSLGKTSDAVAVCQRTLAIREAALGAQHPDVAISLFTLASLYTDSGEYAAALSMGQRSLEIRERAFGDDHQDVAASLSILARIYRGQGDYALALEANGRAFKYWERHFEVNPYLAVTCLNDMANVFQELGDYDVARRYYEGVSAIYEKLYGPENLLLAGCWNNIASIYRQQGAYAEARTLFRRSLNLREKLLGPEHPDVALSLNNLAEILADRDEDAEALKLYQRAWSILEKTFGGEHPDAAVVLNNLAQLYEQQGDSARALLLLERSLQITEKAFGSDHPRVASALNNLASNQQSQGKVFEALKLYRRSLDITERLLGPNHPGAISTLRNIASLHLGNGDLKSALEVYAEAFRRRRSYFQAQYTDAADREATRMFGRDRFTEEMFHSLCATEALAGAAAILGTEQLALNKALLQEVRATQAAMDSAPEKSTQELRQRRQAAIGQLERLPDGTLEPKERKAKQRDLEEEVNALDSKLTGRLGAFAQTLRERSVTVAGIARSLPPESVMVDFIEFGRFDFSAKTNWWKEQRYAAYLTFPPLSGATNFVTERVDLGEAEPVNKAITQLHRLLVEKRIAPSRLGPVLSRLGDLVYAPLAPYLTNVAHLIICPDGELGRLPFELLPVGNTGRHLIEDKRISYVSSGREVVRLAQPRTATPTNAPVVMGFPDFDLPLAAPARELAGPPVRPDSAAAFVAARMPATISRDARGQHFNPLPDTEREARSAAKLLGEDCVLRLGADAREAELKRVVSPRILHLATHGFYLTDQEFRATNSLPDLLAGSFGPRFGRPTVNEDWENPLIRCGIALAGANHAGGLTNAAAEDGILTGLEASLLNLQGTELVILSACQTGAGDVRIGEGVMSLRRAFTIAGAQSVLASHWRVSDEATSRLITEFLRHWRAGKPRVEALREAQLSLLRSKEFSSPYFWAAFTLTGRWD